MRWSCLLILLACSCGPIVEVKPVLIDEGGAQKLIDLLTPAPKPKRERTKDEPILPVEEPRDFGAADGVLMLLIVAGNIANGVMNKRMVRKVGG